MPKPEQGRIVRIETCDPQGRNLKRRPVVIVQRTIDIKAGDPFVCVAITGAVPTKVPEDCVLLPYQAGGHPRTGLKKRCAAMCSWFFKVTEDQIIEYMGIVPKAQLEAILGLVAKLDEQGNDEKE